MTVPILTSQPSTAASNAWLLRMGQDVTQGAPPSRLAQLRDLAGRDTGNRFGDGTATGAHGTAGARKAAVLGRVLVVDDEALVRRTFALSLTKAGFAAVAVEGGKEALDLLRSACEAFDLLVTDQSMPGMTGCELIGAARGLCPGLPVLLVSGYDMSGGGQQLPADVSLLRKPVERAVFLGEVRALLGLAEDEGGG